jgi:glycosyltransferase involved in cell wall biosynthesis
LADRRELFVGVTTSNNALFIGCCLDAVREKTPGVILNTVVLDNYSSDATVYIAESKGAQLVRKACSQPDALNALLDLSRSPYTLLIQLQWSAARRS